MWGARMNEWRKTTIGNVFDVNPKREIKRGDVTSFLPMDALPEHARQASRVETREFTGSGARFKNRDTLLARITPCLENGKTAFVDGLAEDEVAHGSTEYIVLSGKEGISDDLFVYYVARSPLFRSHVIASMDGSSGRQRVPNEAVLRYPVRLPPLSSQRVIARILGTLDDKIELNRRMNETLQAMARAIFKSWFVDFDPVHAKASGESEDSICQRLGLTPEVLAFFPDDFEDSDVGEIPQKWRLSSLAAEAKHHGGFVQTGPFGSQLHAADYVPEGVPVVMPQDLVNRRISVAQVARVTDEMTKRLARHAMKLGDVVYSRRGDVERHALVSEREAGWLCGTGCLLVRLGDTWPSQAYLSEVLDLPVTREWLVRHAVGATMPNLNTSILGAVPLLLPPDALLHAFERIAGPLRTQQIAASIESDSLLLVRDALLPQLLSGALVAPEAP